MHYQIGKKIKNKFWKEVFCSVTSYMQGAIFCNPEKILVAPFWDNPTITRNNKPIRKTAFPAVSCKINTISDFYRPGSVIKLSKDELEDTFGVEISDEVFIELHYGAQNGTNTFPHGLKSTSAFSIGGL